MDDKIKLRLYESNKKGFARINSTIPMAVIDAAGIDPDKHQFSWEAKEEEDEEKIYLTAIPCFCNPDKSWGRGFSQISARGNNAIVNIPTANLKSDIEDKHSRMVSVELISPDEYGDPYNTGASALRFGLLKRWAVVLVKPFRSPIVREQKRLERRWAEVADAQAFRNGTRQRADNDDDADEAPCLRPRRDDGPRDNEIEIKGCKVYFQKKNGEITSYKLVFEKIHRLAVEFIPKQNGRYEHERFFCDEQFWNERSEARRLWVEANERNKFTVR